MSLKRRGSTCMANREMSRLLWGWVVVLALALSGFAVNAHSQSQSPEVAIKEPVASQSESRALLSVKRICVAKLTGDEKFGEQVQAILISSLYTTKRFMVTENCDGADATLKGTATTNREEVSRVESEGIGFGKHVAGASGSWNSSGGSVSAGGAGVAGSTGETLASSTTKDVVNLAVRLVDRDGLVIWATTQESTGNKIKGPAADLADRAVKQLLRDLEKLEPKPPANAD
jgi:hypothetical protein